MAYLLDILGASVIGGFIFLMIANSNARISNLGLELVVVNGKGDYVGGLVGKNSGVITNWTVPSSMYIAVFIFAPFVVI